MRLTARCCPPRSPSFGGLTIAAVSTTYDVGRRSLIMPEKCAWCQRWGLPGPGERRIVLLSTWPCPGTCPFTGAHGLQVWRAQIGPWVGYRGSASRRIRDQRSHVERAPTQATQDALVRGVATPLRLARLFFWCADMRKPRSGMLRGSRTTATTTWHSERCSFEFITPSHADTSPDTRQYPSPDPTGPLPARPDL